LSELKIESARRQLGTALALYLNNQDPVAVHCLAGGECELIEFYAKKRGAQPFTSHILKTFPDLNIREIRQKQRKYWTAFKHATHLHGEGERDDDELLRKFTDDQNDHALFIGWYDYMLAVNKLPIEAQAYQAWYLALYPEKLDPKHSIDRYEERMPRQRDNSRTPKAIAARASNVAKRNADRGFRIARLNPQI
jgi:hypothetical protein